MGRTITTVSTSSRARTSRRSPPTCTRLRIHLALTKGPNTPGSGIRGFHDAPKAAGQTVPVEFTVGNLYIRELDVVAVDEATTGMWDMDNVIGAANEAVKHTGLAVNPWDLETTPHANDRSGPTPSSLAKMVEANNLMPNIKRWSTQNAPNEAWTAAAANMAGDVGADTGSGSGGGAIEACFKALEEENAKLRQEMGSISTDVT